MYRIGIDIGGTFTDVAAVDDEGTVTIAKASSTPSNPADGLLDGLSALAERLGLERRDLLASTSQIVHGTTVATNALLEHKGAKVALLTTAGHRDVIEMREGLKDERYNVRMAPPEPLVPRSRRVGVAERMRFDGTVEIDLTDEAIEAAIDEVAAMDVDAVAVCYLHSYANDAHEVRTAAALRERLPDVYVSLSSEVLPQIKEYERVWTTVVNAYVGPVVARYLTRLRDQLSEAGYERDVLIMHSHGGVASIDDTISLAAGVVLSGPAGGIAAATFATRLLGTGDLITFDMGGTSTDIALVRDHEAQLTSDKRVGLAKVSLPTIDIHTLGAGGGSLAHVAGGILHVGPDSAGADPGPACYGLGGTRASTTDANVVLGMLSPDNFLGGRIDLDGEAAERAVGKIAAELDLGVLEAAQGISRVVNTTMAEGIRVVSVRRGVDPRKFGLISFGGAAGLHVTEVARLLQIERVIVPNVAAVLSAWGMLATDLRAELVRSVIGEVDQTTVEALREVLAAMAEEGRVRLPEFEHEIVTEPSVDMRYGEQIYEINVPIGDLDLSSPTAVEDLNQRFHERHEELYAYSAPGQEVVIVNARMAVVGKLPDLNPRPLVTDSRSDDVRERRIYLDGWTSVPVHDLDGLQSGAKVAGPALIESETTTVLLRSDSEVATVTEHGWLDIQVG